VVHIAPKVYVIHDARKLL